MSLFQRLTIKQDLMFVMMLVKSLKTKKKTAILVTHDIQEAISMADKIIVLTKRPAEIKSIHNVDLKKYGTPFQRRYSPEFSNLFETIWKEIQNEKTHTQLIIPKNTKYICEMKKIKNCLFTLHKL